MEKTLSDYWQEIVQIYVKAVIEETKRHFPDAEEIMIQDFSNASGEKYPENKYITVNVYKKSEQSYAYGHFTTINPLLELSLPKVISIDD